MTQIELKKSEACLVNVSINFRVGLVERKISPLHTWDVPRGNCTVRVTYGYHEGVEDRIITVSGAITVVDNLKGQEFEFAMRYAGELLGVTPVEFMRMIWTAGIDRPWRMEIDPGVVIPEWRNVVFIANHPESQSREVVADRAREWSTATAGAWALD